VAVALESLGIPVPGETAIVVAGIYAGTTHRMSLLALWIAGVCGAVIGDNVGYILGRVGGESLLRRFGPKVGMNSSRLRLARYLFDRHGAKIVFIGRFVAILRAYAAFLAGSIRMHWVKFLVANGLGGVVWVSVFAIGAYKLGDVAERLGHIVGYGLLVLVAALVITGATILRHRLEALQARADECYPDLD
jgi:membrane protein DedA with SNARE-associated domain